MRPAAIATSLTLLSASILLAAGPTSAARRSPESVHCTALADHQKLSGAKRRAYFATCAKGPLAADTPTAPTAMTKESQAVTKPSGVDRTTRTKQCANEADRKGLSEKDRSAFQLSCLATAGPVTEGETGTISPHPAKQINGIGENNYKPSATTAKSKPQH